MIFLSNRTVTNQRDNRMRWQVKPTMTDRKSRKSRKDRTDRPALPATSPPDHVPCHLDQALSVISTKRILRLFQGIHPLFFIFFEVGIAAAIYDMRRLQYGRCVELREKALLAPDCCQSGLRMMLIL